MKEKVCAKCRGNQYLVQQCGNEKMLVYCGRCNAYGRTNKYPIKTAEEYNKIASENGVDVTQNK
jgi:hypothetical protein